MTRGKALCIVESLSHKNYMELLLSQDKYCKYISKEQFLKYIEGAMEIGNCKAEDIKSEQKNVTFRDMPGIMKSEPGIETVTGPGGYQIAAYTVFQGNHCKVVLNEDVIELKLKCLKDWAADDISRQGLITEINSFEKLKGLHLAHEYFHCIEYLRCERVYEKLEPAEVKVLFGKSQKKIRTVSEISAHSFVKSLFSLSVSPVMLDYITMLTTGMLDPDEFQKQLEKIRIAKESVC
ncbi:hypothetical protein [Oribacterium sp. WCC10]|uniref:hypothetical protein n=1 Tax=Oribacterium sp. WCC10 TaxID=1855343 RepID=UPI0008EC6821|nr:hypothetical protein [Oribacterium sp. WCC10]SFG16350.1 hypothetical protein SAMN05216356_102247 [Oribacterium sp. WCC10]